MKILYITNNLNGKDGLSRYSVDLINAVKKFGHSVRVITMENSISRFTAGINFKPDIIHFLAEPYVKLFPQYLSYNTRVTLHGTYAKDLLESKIARHIKGYICVSNFTKNKFSRLFPQDSKVVVISNGIDTSIFKSVEKPNNQIKQILFVGGIKPRKGIQNSIEALKVYAQKYSNNFIYNVVGKYNSNDPYYRKLVSEDKIKIKFYGQVSQKELLEFYLRADLFLMLSITVNDKFEGYGLVYLEANASSVPCIGSKFSGAEDAVLDGKTGYLVDPDNKLEIAERIKDILIEKRIENTDCQDWAKTNDISKKAGLVIDFYKHTY